MPDGDGVLVDGGHVVVADDLQRAGRRYARLLGAELAAVRAPEA